MLIFHQKEEVMIEQVNKEYQKHKNQLSSKLEQYKKEMDDFCNEVKGQSDLNELISNLRVDYDNVLAEHTKFNNIPIDAKIQYSNLLQDEKNAVNELIQNKETRLASCFAEGLAEAIKFSIKEYNAHPPEPIPQPIKSLLDDYEIQLKKSDPPCLQLTEFINQIFSALYSRLHTHPFVELLIHKLDSLLHGKFKIDHGAVFEISPGTFYVRKLTWNSSGQDDFQKHWLSQELKVIENIYKKKKEQFSEHYTHILQEKSADILKKIASSRDLLASVKQEASRLIEQKQKKEQEYQHIKKLIDEVVQIIKNETELLRKKKEHNLFKTEPKDKADRIDAAVRVALDNFDNIIKDKKNDKDVIALFFQFKTDPKLPSIKEALEENRIFYTSTHMYSRIQKKIAVEKAACFAGARPHAG